MVSSSQDLKHIQNQGRGNVYIFPNGEVLPLKKSTIFEFRNIKVAKDFTNDEWIEEHIIILNSGLKCILVKQSACVFKKY